MQMFGAIPEETIQAAAQGSASAREALMKALLPQVRAMVIVRLAPTPAQFPAVDDLTQQALMGVSSGLSTLRHPLQGALASFVSTIVARTVAAFLRQGAAAKNRRPVRSLDSSIIEDSVSGALRDFLQASALTPRSIAARAELVRRVVAALGELKPEHREVITLAFFDRLSMSEIAERMQLARSAASMQLVRAVRALRRMVTGSSRLGGVL